MFWKKVNIWLSGNRHRRDGVSILMEFRVC